MGRPSDAVYECAELGIPFIAASVGGVPDLAGGKGAPIHTTTKNNAPQLSSVLPPFTTK